MDSQTQTLIASRGAFTELKDFHVASFQERCWRRAAACCSKWEMLRAGRTPLQYLATQKWYPRGVLAEWMVPREQEAAMARPLARPEQHELRAMVPQHPAEMSLAQVESPATRSDTFELLKPIETAVLACRLLEANRDLQVLQSSPMPSYQSLFAQMFKEFGVCGCGHGYGLVECAVHVHRQVISSWCPSCAVCTRECSCQCGAKTGRACDHCKSRSTLWSHRSKPALHRSIIITSKTSLALATAVSSSRMIVSW